MKSPLPDYTDEQYTAFPFTERALLQAAAWVGQREDPPGSNKGPFIALIAQITGGPVGAAWCAEFVTACCIKAGCDKRALPVDFASTHSWLVWAQIGRRVEKAPKRGDVFFIDHGGGLGHVGWVTAFADGVVSTIEGNSNNDGSREGYEVVRHKRPANTITAFISMGGLA